MQTKINSLPIVLDRKATFYEGVGDGDTDIFYNFDSDENIILTSDGTIVEYWIPPFFDDRCRPFSELQITLNISIKEFMEWTQSEDTFVDLILIDGDKIIVTITTQSDVIYDEVHSIR